MKKELTVIVMTYNQVSYIKKAIDSILMQKIDIDFDILIHDDCSDDGTYEILCKYKNKIPNKIHIIRQKERRFLIDGFNMMIFKYIVPNISSRFVAYCDGDDYWCDEHKLQKQYDFMIQNPQYSMCFHSAYQLRDEGDMSSNWFFGDECDIEMCDVINDRPGIRVPTSSIFLQSSSFKDFSEWRMMFPVEDVPMYMTALLHGKVHRFSEKMCVYRQFASGSYTAQLRLDEQKVLKHAKETIDAITFFDKDTDFKYHNLVILQIGRYNFRIALSKKDYKTVFNKQYKRFFKQLPIRERVSLFLQYKAPCFYGILHKKRKNDL